MKLFTVINYTRKNGNIIATISPNSLTSDIMIFPESDYVAFLDRHDKLNFDGIDDYFNNTQVLTLLYDMYDFILSTQIDVDHAMTRTILNINHIVC